MTVTTTPAGAGRTPGTPVAVVRDATTPTRRGDLRMHSGIVTEHLPGPDAPAPPGVAVSAGGAVVSPAFVDAHVHLDKAFLLEAAQLAPGESGVTSAIDATRRAREVVTADRQRELARRGCDALRRYGVVAARAHVEIDSRLDLLRLHGELADELRGVLDLQLSAFPQHGIDRTVRSLMEQALKDGAEVVGGCPYVDDDQHAHLDVVFDLADRLSRPVDLHLDFDDDPSGSMVAAVAERTRALGLQGRVTVGHVTKLAVMSPDEQSRAFDLLAAADIALVVMPATDLYLNGGGEPGHRSLAPVERAWRAGVRVAISNNNLYNAFSPYGNGSLLQAAWTAGLIRALAEPGDQRALLEAITRTPADVLGRASHGTEVGDVADLVVLDTDDADGLVLRNPEVLATIKAGRLVHRRPAVVVGPPDDLAHREPEAARA